MLPCVCLSSRQLTAIVLWGKQSQLVRRPITQATSEAGGGPLDSPVHSHVESSAPTSHSGVAEPALNPLLQGTGGSEVRLVLEWWASQRRL